MFCRPITLCSLHCIPGTIQASDGRMLANPAAEDVTASVTRRTANVHCSSRRTNLAVLLTRLITQHLV
jgi:hypothetical protein